MSPTKNNKSEMVSIMLYAVASEAIEDAMEDKDHLYIHGYRVNNEYLLTESNKKLLIETVESDSIYSKNLNSRRCPHYAQYAIKYGEKSFVISTSPCPKIYLFMDDSADEPKLIDLVDNNKLERVIVDISSSIHK